MQRPQGLTYVALMCERLAVSDRTGAAIGPAVFKYFGVIGDDNFAEIIESISSAKLPKVYNFC